MKRSEIENYICRFVKEFSGPEFLNGKMNLVSEISGKLDGKISSSKEVREYLDFVINKIQQLLEAFQNY